LAKFLGNTLNLNENIAKSFRGATVFLLTLYTRLQQNSENGSFLVELHEAH